MPEELLNVTMELGSTAAIKEALMAGLGVSILSKTSIQRDVEDGHLKILPIRGIQTRTGLLSGLSSESPSYAGITGLRSLFKTALIKNRSGAGAIYR